MCSNTRLNSFQDLAKFNFPDDSNTELKINIPKINRQIPSKIKPINNIAKKVNENKNSIYNKAQQYENIHYKIKVSDSCKSTKHPKLKFSNYLQSHRNQHADKVRNVLAIDGSSLRPAELPFCLYYEESLNIKHRQKTILESVNIDINPNTPEISKSAYKDEVDKLFNLGANDNNKGQSMRIYSIIDNRNRTIEIIFLDLYHLLATTKYTNYDEVKSYNICIKKI